MAERTPSTTLVRGKKEHLGKSVLHVEGQYHDVQGQLHPYMFNIRRGPNRFFFGRVSDSEIEAIRKKIDALPGSPETITSLQKGKAGPKETVENTKNIRSNRVKEAVSQQASQARMLKDYTPALQTAQSLATGVRTVELTHHQTLVREGKAFPVTPRYEKAARRVIYGKDGADMARSVASSLVMQPSQAIEEAAKYIDQRYLDTKAQGEKISKGERLLKNRGTWGILSGIPVVNQVLTLYDDLNTLADVLGKGPGTLKGKLLYQGGAALLSDISDLVVGGLLDSTVVGIIGSWALSFGTNLALNPASIEHSRLRVEDQRYMLQMHTANELLTVGAGISHTKQLEIAQAVIDRLGPRMDTIHKQTEGRANDPKVYYANLEKEVYTRAQSFFLPQNA